MRIVKIVSQCFASGKIIAETECEMCGFKTAIYRNIKAFQKNMPFEKCQVCGLTSKDVETLMQSPIPSKQSPPLRNLYSEMEEVSKRVSLSPEGKQAFVDVIEALNKLNTSMEKQ
jgi:predicted RNA-binding Zn-ribbon protein involved in translation (DUF1610 family)